MSENSAKECSAQDEVIDLKELATAIWKGKWFIIAVTTLFVVLAVFYALSVPNQYKSTAILAPASSSNSSSLSSLAGQFGGLASLAGVNLGGGSGDNKVVVAMEIIKTWDFLEQFIVENDLQVEAFAVNGWNRLTRELIIDPEVYDMSKRTWVRDLDPAKGQLAEPSSWELFNSVKGRISVSQDKQSGLISLTVEHFSPDIAKKWVDNLIVSINARFQLRDKQEAVRRIDYLKSKVEETNVSDMQTVFYQLIEEQTKTLMLAEVSDEYVFKTVSPAKVAVEKSKPKRALIVIFSCVLGGVLSTFIVLIYFFGRGRRAA
jgi:uncharacterized protein involved in exopolysaccharide biosynthesis